MRKYKYLIVTLLFIILCHFSFAQSVSSESATASVNLISPIKIEQKSDLNFGNIVKSADGQQGFVEIDALTGGVTYTGTSTVGENTVSRASFVVSGNVGSTYSITIADVGGSNQLNRVTLTRDGGTETMTAELNHSKAGDESFVISSNENDNYGYVGGKLALSADQVVGSYQGSFTVTVAYQ